MSAPVKLTDAADEAKAGRLPRDPFDGAEELHASDGALGCNGASSSAAEKGGSGSAKKGAAKALVEIAERFGVELFVDELDDAYAAIPLGDGGREIRRVTYTYFKGWLAKRYFEELYPLIFATGALRAAVIYNSMRVQQ